MILPNLPFWLKGTISTAFRNLAQDIWTQVETKLEMVFESARFKHQTATGLEITWADMPIRPEGMDLNLKRYFAQYYEQIMSVVATRAGLDLIGVIFNLPICWQMEMRDQPNAADYSWTAVRLWINPVSPGQFLKIDLFFRLMLPARCIFWRELSEWTPSSGFGASPFGNSFGD